MKGLAPLGYPRIYWGLPFLDTPMSLTDASHACFKDSICPRLDNYASCFQCAVHNSKEDLKDDTKDLFVKLYDSDMTRNKKICESIGVTASKHTEVVYNGPRTTAAAVGPLLIALGVAVAACL